MMSTSLVTFSFVSLYIKVLCLITHFGPFANFIIMFNLCQFFIYTFRVFDSVGMNWRTFNNNGLYHWLRNDNLINISLI